MSDTRHAQLISWLEDQGHDAAQIEKIMAKVEAYDSQTIHESVFDSIDSGTIDLAAIIRETVGDDEQ